tara:strand:- start:304 stop:480 length:177 start_codon:yes stop_codon:yes gene_type:complete
MYLDTTILQSRTCDTLIEFIDLLADDIICCSPEIASKYQEIKRQQRKAKKLEKGDIDE